ncbi:MAG: YaiO family outer membrane beta-barrel protein [Candidatus Electryonea clarkiae]|nr:YaiO family outer membrane beta-barrel protein [Candidatus Electryonea clarkiae]
MKYALAILLISIIVVCPIIASPISDGRKAIKNEDFKTAIQTFQDYLIENPESYEAAFELGRALAFDGNHEEAIEVLTNLIDSHPDDADAHLMRGRVYAWNKQFDIAEKDLKFVTSDYPEYADAWSALGSLYLWSNRPGLATSAYSRWISINPNSPEPYIARAKTFRATREFSKARQDLETATELDGDAFEIDKLLRSLSRIPSATMWEGRFNFILNTYMPSRPDWNTYETSVKREIPIGSIALGYKRITRFDQWDYSFYLDSYLDLWRKSYGNFRIESSPDYMFLPRTDYILEIFQGIGIGWEISGGFHLMQFPDLDVDIYLLSLGKYLGPWYLRERAILTTDDGKINQTHLIGIRYYPGNIDDYIELTIGVSKQAQEVTNMEIQNEIFQKASYSLLFQKFLLKNYGMSVSGMYQEDFDRLIERSLIVSLIIRW